MTCIDARHAHGTLKAQRIKTDKNDARGLAQIARTGWYKATHVKSDDGQALRALVGGRKQLVEHPSGHREPHSRHVQDLRHQAGAVTAAGFSAKVKTAIRRERIPSSRRRSRPAQARDGILAQQRHWTGNAPPSPGKTPCAKRLKTIPGVGIITALTYKAEIDDPLRFRKSRDVGVHIGLTPRRLSSGEVDRSGRHQQVRQWCLANVLFEASVTMLTRSGKWSRLKSWGVRLAQRNGFKVASTAMARKLAVIMHRMWVDETDFAYGKHPPLRLRNR